jgi:hypothetical protein
MRLTSLSKVFDAESRDVTAKANIVKAVNKYINQPLENERVYPVAALTRCQTQVRIINDNVPKLMILLMEYPLLQYATNLPQKTDHETTVASKYHQ